METEVDEVDLGEEEGEEVGGGDMGKGISDHPKQCRVSLSPPASTDRA